MGNKLENRTDESMENDIFDLIDKWRKEGKTRRQLLDLFFGITCKTVYNLYKDKWKDALIHQINFTNVEEIDG